MDFNDIKTLMILKLKKRLQHTCFPVKFATFFRAPILTEHLLTTAPEKREVKSTKQIAQSQPTSSFFKIKPLQSILIQIIISFVLF